MTASLAVVNPYFGRKGSDVDILRGDLYKYSVCGKTGAMEGHELHDLILVLISSGLDITVDE